MRGKLKNHADISNALGITPADAGKTETVKGIPAAEEDHPRGCGENWRRLLLLLLRLGSPPRMRGKPTTPRCRIWGIGITPADAGKTNLRWATYSEQKDHPRGCGENQELPGVAGG